MRALLKREGSPCPQKPGTLGLLVVEYKQHAAFIDLAERTRSDYQRTFDYLRPIEGTPLTRFDAPLVVRIRDKAAEGGKRRWANYVKSVLSTLFSWGVERGLMASNPAKGVKNIRRPKSTPDANRRWMDAERHVVLDEAPAHMRPALALMAYTECRASNCNQLARTSRRSESALRICGKTIGDGRSLPNFGFG